MNHILLKKKCFSKLPKMLYNILASFVGEFVTNAFQKQPNLVALIAT